MAKQGKVLLARRHREHTEGSVLLRSAESLGRVIGSLQRQLDEAAKRLAPVMNTGNGASTARPAGKAKKPQAEARKTSKSKSTGARKSASSSGSRKTAGTRRSRSG
jgi:hypothetical protein